MIYCESRGSNAGKGSAKNPTPLNRTALGFLTLFRLAPSQVYQSVDRWWPTYDFLSEKANLEKPSLILEVIVVGS